MFCRLQRQKGKISYVADGLPDDEIDGRYSFSVEEKLRSTKFSDVPKFYNELNGSGAFSVHTQQAFYNTYSGIPGLADHGQPYVGF